MTPQPTSTSSWKTCLQTVDMKLAIKAGITAAISFSIGVAFNKLFQRPDNLVNGLWCILTSLVVLQPHLGGTYKAAWIRLLGIAIGSIVGVVFTTLFGSSPLPLSLGVACTVAICSLAGLGDSFRIAAMSVSVVMVLWGLHPTTSPWVFGFYRFLDSCLGILIALVVTLVIWPTQATSSIQLNIAKALQALNRLYLNASNVDILKDQSEKMSKEDSQELEETFNENLKFLEESRMELLPKSGNVDDWRTLNHACETLFEEITAMISIEKHNLSMILDEQLCSNLNALIDQTDSGLKAMANQLKSGATDPSISPLLRNAIKNLKDDLIRFRSTKATRKFELQDVEGFFVYFYTIILIAEQLPPLEESIKKILSMHTPS